MTFDRNAPKYESEQTMVLTSTSRLSAVVLAIFVIPCAVGCKKPDQKPSVNAVTPEFIAPAQVPAQTPTPVAVEPKTAPVAETPLVKRDEKLIDFKTKVKEYIAESRAGVKFISLSSSLADVAAKSTQIKDLYAHIPDAPSSVEDRDNVEKLLKGINGSFAVLALNMEQSRKAASLKSEKIIAMSKDLADSSSKKIKDNCDEIERLLNL